MRGKGEDAPPLALQFYDDPELETIEWEEFFDSFETSGLAFRYDENAERGSEDFSYSFVAREPVGPSLSGAEMEDSSVVRENLFPSAPSDKGGPDKP